MGALSISTTSQAAVFIDGIQVGSTTSFFSDKIEAKEHLIKLVPEEKDKEFVPWEGKVNIFPNVLTVINHAFGPTEAESAGEIFWLEKIPAKDKSSLAIVSLPDQAVVKVDGEPKGFTPLLLEDLTPRSYQITVVSSGYEERSISAKTVGGFKLIINVHLAQKAEGIQEATEAARVILSPTSSPKITPSQNTTPKPTFSLEKPYVVIKETPTGWLRVRTEPSTSATEAAKVRPGETYPYLNEEKNGWYKIEYEEKKEGWVSGVYVELVE